MNRMVYIVLTKTKTVLSKAIQIYTQHDFNHVSISFDAELKEMYSFGRKNINNPWIGGFVHENPSSTLLRESNCVIFACPVTEQQYTLLKNRIAYYKQNKNVYKYNFIGLFGVACRVKIKRERAFFCSQFVATLFEEAGLPIYGKSPYFMKPHDFIHLPYLTFIYKGKVENFIGVTQEKHMRKRSRSALHAIALSAIYMGRNKVS
ncbi:hypothetical protein [Ureibacillus aquaedulcis]|uniref:Permuted papain-like amidase YaeF/Yiix C92 family enzyme n=1 Tax=Ureibacillus aquaedulcis TaxID=3058421 RepID=A0ABT8GTC0_9BACL|nr:hypothetical protein [Ureibacillus sp. BA0131]MDN4494667.1 hypothetical protein [Ureibacillus sp. BA0131]